MKRLSVSMRSVTTAATVCLSLILPSCFPPPPDQSPSPSPNVGPSVTLRLNGQPLGLEGAVRLFSYTASDPDDQVELWEPSCGGSESPPMTATLSSSRFRQDNGDGLFVCTFDGSGEYHVSVTVEDGYANRATSQEVPVTVCKSRASVVDFFGESDFGSGAVVYDSDVVVAGFAAHGKPDFALARLKGKDGTLASGFGSGGKVTSRLTSGIDQGRAVTIQGDGIVVAGVTDPTSKFTVARYLLTGVLRSRR